MSIASVEQLVGVAPTSVMPVVVARKELPGLRKAAVFLAQLSKEEAGAVLAQLRPSEVEKLTTELMRLQGVDAGDVDDVLTEFHTLMQARRFVGTGGIVNMSATDHLGLDLSAFRMLEIEGGEATLQGTEVLLSAEAAELLNSTFMTDALAGDFLIGTATITVPTS